jgi:hypothetical protein
MPNGLLPLAGKKALAYHAGQNVTHAAIGRGDWADKQNPPMEDFNGDALKDEIGRITISEVAYLMADAEGTIQFSGDSSHYRFATEAEIDDAALEELAPSNQVVFKFIIPENVAVGELVCEIALIYQGTTTTAGFATGGQVTDPGHVFYVVNIPGNPIEPDKELERWVRVIM